MKNKIILAIILTFSSVANAEYNCDNIAAAVKSMADLDMVQRGETDKDMVLDFLKKRIGLTNLKVALYIYKNATDEALRELSVDQVKDICEAIVYDEV